MGCGSCRRPASWAAPLQAPVAAASAAGMTGDATLRAVAQGARTTPGAERWSRGRRPAGATAPEAGEPHAHGVDALCRWVRSRSTNRPFPWSSRGLLRRPRPRVWPPAPAPSSVGKETPEGPRPAPKQAVECDGQP